MTTICAKISHEDSLVHFAILNCGGGDGVVYLQLWVGGWVGGEESPCCEEFVICVCQHKPVV